MEILIWGSSLSITAFTPFQHNVLLVRPSLGNWWKLAWPVHERPQQAQAGRGSLGITVKLAYSPCPPALQPFFGRVEGEDLREAAMRGGLHPPPMSAATLTASGRPCGECV